METNFFSQIAQLCGKAGLKLTITPKEGDVWLVTILPFRDGLNDPATNIIQPLNLRGTAAVLDAGFFNTIQQPLQKSVGLFSNMDGFNKSLEAAKAKSKMEQESQVKDKRDKEQRKTKYEEAMKKVKEFEESEKYGQAIAQLPKPAEFPDQADEIKKKMDELRAKHGQLELL